MNEVQTSSTSTSPPVASYLIVSAVLTATRSGSVSAPAASQTPATVPAHGTHAPSGSGTERTTLVISSAAMDSAGATNSPVPVPSVVNVHESVVASPMVPATLPVTIGLMPMLIAFVMLAALTSMPSVTPP